ncbi:MAG TPA: hypothetical protein VM925_33585, partial [Labilithrix sp.]|nr:hypothetical protein [Labilithrix sp.]
MRLLRCSLLGAALCLAPRAALAQSDPAARSTDGTVLAIDSGDLVVDVGAVRGVREGQLVELWRPVRIKHPVSGKLLTDRFHIGTIRLAQVQNTLSLAKVEGTFLRPPAVGDQIVLPNVSRPDVPDEKREVTTKPAPIAPPAKVIVSTDADAQAVADLFEALRGATPEARATAYETFARARPKSRFVAVLQEEAAALRSRTKNEEPPIESSFAPVERLRPGAPQRFAVELDARFIGAVLHARKKESAGYRSVPMTSVGPRYWSATLPGDVVDEPAMEYFIEGVPKVGAPIAVVGTASSPKEAQVDPRPLTGKKPGTLAQATIATEFASFNTKKANDYLFQTEGTFGFRLGDRGIRAVRSGFGVLRGKGGTLADLDVQGKEPKSVGLTYGYVEGELGISP